MLEKGNAHDFEGASRELQYRQWHLTQGHRVESRKPVQQALAHSSRWAEEEVMMVECVAVWLAVVKQTCPYSYDRHEEKIEIDS